ncbi:carboxyl transferase domain-containing protein [Bacillus pacificus]
MHFIFSKQLLRKDSISYTQEPNNSIKTLEEIIPENQNAPFNMKDLINRVIDERFFLEVKKLFAQELITGFSTY